MIKMVRKYFHTLDKIGSAKVGYTEHHYDDFILQKWSFPHPCPARNGHLFIAWPNPWDTSLKAEGLFYNRIGYCFGEKYILCHVVIGDVTRVQIFMNKRWSHALPMSLTFHEHIEALQLY